MPIVVIGLTSGSTAAILCPPLAHTLAGLHRICDPLHLGHTAKFEHLDWVQREAEALVVSAIVVAVARQPG